MAYLQKKKGKQKNQKSDECYWNIEVVIMVIQHIRVEIVNRGDGGSACCKGALNARSKINDTRTNITYNFQNRGDNVYTMFYYQSMLI